MILLSYATNTQMTLTFDLDLDTDLAKRWLSYVSIMIYLYHQQGLTHSFYMNF
jgi:hypothetical protein